MAHRNRHTQTNSETESTAQTGEETQQKTGEDSVSRVIIYRGASAGSPEQLSQPESFSARLSRARGRGIGSVASTEEEETEHPTRTYTVSLSEGQLYSETGLFMRFRNPEDTALTGGDLLTDPEEPSYVVPQPTVDALPFEVREQLNSAGFVLFTGTYSAEDERFHGVSLGWQNAVPNLDPVMIQMKLIHETEITEIPALDFVLAQFQDVSPQEIARARGVSVRTVKSNIERGQESFQALL